MDESQKPFACSIEGCEMTFTNEDHLNWHNKKHDMVLNLGLSKSVEVADQTPTPTRFIRNCEEVGLFQDLQNVNPFDETFKKAMESGKSGLHVPEAASNDDTLHTPHIFPHVVNTGKYIDTRNDNHSTTSNDFCIDSVPSIEDNDVGESYDLTIDDTEPENDLKNKVKNKLKETIKNKVKTPAITPVPLEKLQSSTSEAAKRPQTSEKNDTNKKQKIDEDVGDDGKAKIRELNRAAQLRCRKRKQVQMRRMEDDMRILKIENARLHHENQYYKHKIYSMKEILLKQKTTKDIPVLTKIEHILNASTPLFNSDPLLEKKASKSKTVKDKPIAPIIRLPVIQNPEPQRPLLIQLIGSVSQVAVSVVPNK